jgi:hypothetical protein
MLECTYRGTTILKWTIQKSYICDQNSAVYDSRYNHKTFYKFVIINLLYYQNYQCT